MPSYIGDILADSNLHQQVCEKLKFHTVLLFILILDDVTSNFISYFI